MASIARDGLDFDKIYPIGSIYMSVNSANPSSLFGGKWEQLSGRFLIGVGTGETNTTNFWGDDSWDHIIGTVEEKGGQAWHTLTEAELPVIDGSFRVPVVGGHSLYGVRGHAYGSSWGDDGRTSNEYSNGSGATMNWGYGYKFGSGQAHNNMPPYLAVYMWKRIS